MAGLARHYRFDFKEDVTVAELAEILQRHFKDGCTTSFYRQSSDNVKRHLKPLSKEEISCLPQNVQDDINTFCPVLNLDEEE